MIEVMCFAEGVIDFFPQEGDALYPSFSAFPGGAGINVAVALARLGVRSGFMGKVGQDAFGELVKETLQREGVDTRGLFLDPGESTALTFVFHHPVTLEPFFVRYGEADMNFTLQDISWELLEEIGVFHCVSLGLVRESLRSATLEILEFCKERDIFVSFDLNHRPRLWSDLQEARYFLWKVVREADLVKLNREELRFLTQQDTLTAGVEVLLGEGIRNGVITLGGRGAFMVNRFAQETIPAFTISPVDLTGCGDAFCAGMIHQVVTNRFPRGMIFPPDQFCQMVTFASACGAIAATRWGTVPSFPFLREAEEFLAKSGGF